MRALTVAPTEAVASSEAETGSSSSRTAQWGPGFWHRHLPGVGDSNAPTPDSSALAQLRSTHAACIPSKCTRINTNSLRCAIAQRTHPASYPSIHPHAPMLLPLQCMWNQLPSDLRPQGSQGLSLLPAGVGQVHEDRAPRQFGDLRDRASRNATSLSTGGESEGWVGEGGGAGGWVHGWVV